MPFRCKYHSSRALALPRLSALRRVAVAVVFTLGQINQDQWVQLHVISQQGEKDVECRKNMQD